MPTNTEQLKRAIQLTEQIDSLQGELDRILSGLKVGGGSNAVTSPPAPKGVPGRKKGKMSAAGRAAIIAAQKARWAKVNAAKGGKAPATSPVAKAGAKPAAKKKRTFSPAARAKMAAAAKARWAKRKG